MKNVVAIVLILFLICVAAIGYIANTAKKAQGSVVAAVNGKVITAAMLDKRIQDLPQYYQSFASQHKREVVDDMAVEQILYDEAKKRRLENNPDVKALINEAQRKILISKLIEDITKKSAPVSDDDITAYYNEHKDQYGVPEVVRASHILTNTEEEAKKVQDELKQGADFGELAKKYSKDLTKDRGGDLGYFRKGQMIPEFEKACFSLKVGQTSDIVKTRFGYHIIKLTDRKEPSFRPLEEAKEGIRSLILRERERSKFEELVKELKAKAKISINEKFFAGSDEKAKAQTEPAPVPAPTPAKEAPKK